MSDDIGDPGRPMSDTKKPKLSEIVAFQKMCPLTTMNEAFLFDNCAYLLDLVERMGDELEQHADHSEFCGSSENPGHKKARALVEESKQ